ncbi:5-bromo-4-chloroindolyl phosphate hydrolysis family protein [Marinilactibacillus psychrotolerans]|uniref:Phosphatase n=2 Tax=Marinilactibacillus psychrotolerans TaxID=191770 RepID=A0A5R9C4A8_9LACT|nr:5-bromo-4-chloroindolyl phosphate hydrolysis family protein [Marinilactibacillus psychrotolerans]TLQ07723.1 phosphatase [Marinilactibacillus psychrotolerans]SJN21885.1 5-bromo-4-chloroindolyl phosphate hydrolysis protein [Marinilactibacillus psychrotolerans 42ea]
MNKNRLADTLIYLLTCITILFIFITLVAVDFPIIPAALFSATVGVLLLYMRGRKHNNHDEETKLPKLSAEKEAFYESKGLGKEDIQYFRQTMQNAKAQIKKIETNLQATGKLKAIENRNNTVHLTKSLFREIIKEPNRLHEVDQFLYVHLPSLADLSEKYVEIDNHEAKSKATYDMLDRSSQTLDEMCQQIAVDYVEFKSDDIEDMEVEVELAKRSLDKDNGLNQESIQNDEV